jgi:hypothetical protein
VAERRRLLHDGEGRAGPSTPRPARWYDIEVGRFIANHRGVKLDLVRLDWKGILPGLQTGRFDVVFSNVTRRSARRRSTTRSRTRARLLVGDEQRRRHHQGVDGGSLQWQVFTFFKTGTTFVWCVRGGQGVDPSSEE